MGLAVKKGGNNICNDWFDDVAVHLYIRNSEIILISGLFGKLAEHLIRIDVLIKGTRISMCNLQTVVGHIKSKYVKH